MAWDLFGQTVIPILFWPAIVTAALLSAIGITIRRPAWVVVGIVLSLPFSLYLFATPRFRLVGPVLPFLLIGATVATQRGNPWAAWLLWLAHVGFFLWLATL